MSTKGTRGKGTRGRGRSRGGARAGSSASGHMPNNEAREAPTSPLTETGSHDPSLLQDEAYQWWLTVKEGSQPDRLTWEFFKTAFLGKYVGASYVDVQRREFQNLTQGDKLVAEYESEFLRLSRYACGMVATEYKRCVHFEDGLRDDLRVLIAPQRELDFSVLVEKAKIAKDVKRVEHQNLEKDRGKNKRV
ncbi:uncharacterized protein [Gossypium hirsutum]|uniref:Retrotransposon gag domain-containing protein n=1 Tax=Gossypium hirsutum TaxID=3635 RepID=A0ABM2ZBK4_GOSHI|nr:uncharacterized protein LOC121211387 [Gossypium hirsutum]